MSNRTVLKPDNPLGQVNIFAQPRSGGTLLNIFMRNLVSFKCSLVHPLMVHSDNVLDYGPYNVILTRHPLGIIGSMIHVDSIDRKSNRIIVDEKNVRAKIDEFNRGQEIFDNLVDNNPETVIIKYENFHNNYDFLYRLANDEFNVKINLDEFKQWQQDFEVNRVKKDIENDTAKEDDYRPHHISSGKGDNYANINLIPDHYRDELNERLKPILIKYDYEEIDLNEYPYQQIRELN